MTDRAQEEGKGRNERRKIESMGGKKRDHCFTTKLTKYLLVTFYCLKVSHTLSLFVTTLLEWSV